MPGSFLGRQNSKMGRRRRHRKRFECGHQGFGQYCHRCAAQKSAMSSLQAIAPLENFSSLSQAVRQQQAARQAWQQQFVQDPIDLTHLPRAIVLKARRVLTALAAGVSLHQLQGKRFSFDRNLIRIPVSHRYRLLCRQDPTEIRPLKVLSHEAYNPIARHKVRLGK